MPENMGTIGRGSRAFVVAPVAIAVAWIPGAGAARGIILLVALVAVGAAMAARCGAALEPEIADARRLGVSGTDLPRAARIGTRVREVGATKTDEGAAPLTAAAGNVGR